MKKLNFVSFILFLFSGCKRETFMPKSSNTTNNKKTKSVIFFGDSITQFGMLSGGYIRVLHDSLVKDKLDTIYDLVGRGIAGDKVIDLWDRVDQDVIGENPSVVFIYIGINDVWHYPPVEDLIRKQNFKSVYTELVNKIKLKINARIILCTPSVIGEKKNGVNPYDFLLDEYSIIIKEIASSTSSELCDLRAAFKKGLQLENNNDVPSGIFTTDQVHLNARGNQLVAKEIWPFINQ